MRIGHPGAGSVGDFCVQLINALAGADLVPVPHTGAAPAVIALRGGHIEGVVLALGALSTHIKTGAFRGLVASSRVPDVADIPTLRELGYQEELFGIWFSFLAPAGIPEDARKALVRRDRAGGQVAGHHGQARPARHPADLRQPGAAGRRDPRGAKRVSEMARKAGLVK